MAKMLVDYYKDPDKRGENSLKTDIKGVDWSPFVRLDVDALYSDYQT
jgi:hypothetical protein